ncbi:MAG TPA: hypothetical protein VIY52_04580 [Streptosporangiaceae bacterium]
MAGIKVHDPARCESRDACGGDLMVRRLTGDELDFEGVGVGQVGGVVIGAAGVGCRSGNRSA